MKICIVGTSRCGTTLLRSILHRNNDISLFNETHWIPKMYEFFGMQSVNWQDMFEVAANTTWDSGKDLFAVNTLYSKYEDVSVMLNDFKSELKIHKRVNIQQFSDILANTVFDNPKHWGDKTPDYGYYMGLVQQIWPHCKFIHVTRDGLATARSMARHSGCKLMISGGYHNWCSLSYDKLYKKYSIKELPISKYIQSWAVRMNRIRDESNRLKKGSYLEISYENILRHPKETLLKIENFAELSQTLTHNDVSELGINTNKLKPVAELTRELINLTQNELLLLNEGYGSTYFKQFTSVDQVFDELKSAHEKHLSATEQTISSCISILASPISIEHPQLSLKAQQLLVLIKTQQQNTL